jgi:2-hydroxy-4-carboxymuconate semialdehyde hemiacetal dehydrogenase
VDSTAAVRCTGGAATKIVAEESMKVVMVGQGAFGRKHLDGLKNIDDVEVVSLAGGSPESTEAIAKQYGIPHWTSDLSEALAQPGVEAAIIASPTQMHADQAVQVLKAGKHVEVEIPIADSLADAQRIADAQKESGLIAMAGHTRRFNPSHQYVHNKIVAGELKLQQLVVQTYFFRRKNINLEGKPRSWTDHLLWHHACHTVDLFQYQTGETASDVFALEGPHHPELGIAMDMCIGMKTPSGATCNLSLSFNNDGPQGTFFRYICDNGTYVARYDDLFDGKESQIDLSDVAVSMNGIELQDREFISAIREGREPNSSVQQVLPAMQTLDRLEKCL